jgi:hypothetical protein
VSEVILFNHIPKSAGSTMKHVLWRAVGADRVLSSLVHRAHRERIAAIAAELDRRLDGRYAVASHVGCGVEEWLPARHSYPAFTLLRDPIERTVSRYWHYRSGPNYRSDAGRAAGSKRMPAGMSLERFLDESVLHSFNVQTAFLGGLWARHHLEGAPLTRSRFDERLLAEAKRKLESHAVVGLTERFDETLLLLRDAFGWPRRRTTYRRMNVGSAGRRSGLGDRDREAVRASNELDIELYEFAQELFESRLAERVSDPDRRVRGFRRLNRAYDRVYPVTLPARALAKSVRRVR